MNPDDSQQSKSNLSDAHRALYSRKAVSREHTRAPIHARTYQVKESWGQAVPEVALKKKKGYSSFFKKFFIFGLIFCLGALGFAAYSLIRGANTVTPENIGFDIIAPNLLDGGTEQIIQIEITNRNPVALRSPRIVLEYSESTRASGEDVKRLERSLDTITPGATLLEDFPIVLFGEEGQERTLTARLEYRVDASNALFTSTTDHVITLLSTPLDFIVTLPDELVPGQPITIDLEVFSNSLEVLNDIMISADYPMGFRFESASSDPTFGESLWVVGDLRPNETKTLTINGFLDGVTNQEQRFQFSIGVQDTRREQVLATVYNTVGRDVMLKQPFLALRPMIDRAGPNDIPVANAGSRIPITLEWENNGSMRLTNVVIEAFFSGNAFNPQAIGAQQGFFDSNTNTVRFAPTTSPVLAAVAPGEGGSFRIDISPRPLVSSTGSIENPVIEISYSLEGVDETGALTRINNALSQKILINSDFRLTQRTLYHSGPFTSYGPIPPRVGTPTSYTLVWTVTNTSNEVRDAVLTTRLPLYATWTNRVIPQREDVSYNEVTREITWNLGTLPPGVGTTVSPREVYIQLEILSSLSLVGSSAPLTEELLLSGRDRFTNFPLEFRRSGHTTRLMNDTSSTGADGRIIAQ